MRRITIKDLARDLELSVSTVSRGLSGDPSISQATRRRIIDAAERLGYHRNVLAARLRSGRSNTVGVLVNEMNTPMAGQLVSGIHEVLDKQGIGVMIANSDNDTSRELRHLRMFANAMVDGIIVMLCDNSCNFAELQRLIAAGIPVVFCDYTNDGRSHSAKMNVSTVTGNHYKKAFFLVDHLLRSGRRRVVHMKGRSVLPKYEMLHAAYKEALQKYDVAYEAGLVVDTDITLGAGRAAVDELLARGEKFDTIFACHDAVAIGAMNRLRELGKRVPEDVAVAGYSGSELSMMSYPPLTTVEMPMREMGIQAAEMISGHIQNPSLPPSTVVVDGKIHLRPSSHVV